MGWHKRSYVGRYDFSIIHAFIIVGRVKGIIEIFLYYKDFRKCDAAEKIGEETEEHDFRNNFEGSSKIMEASAILNMVEDAFYNRFFIIDVIVRDDESTIKSVLNHPSISVRGQVQKSSKVKLD